MTQSRQFCDSCVTLTPCLPQRSSSIGRNAVFQAALVSPFPPSPFTPEGGRGGPGGWTSGAPRRLASAVLSPVPDPPGAACREAPVLALTPAPARARALPVVRPPGAVAQGGSGRLRLSLFVTSAADGAHGSAGGWDTGPAPRAPGSRRADPPSRATLRPLLCGCLFCVRVPAQARPSALPTRHPPRWLLSCSAPLPQIRRPRLCLDAPEAADAVLKVQLLLVLVALEGVPLLAKVSLCLRPFLVEIYARTPILGGVLRLPKEIGPERCCSACHCRFLLRKSFRSW
jgi:hypothetical protein